ncbi:hypothetical protein C8Q79DRAFT_1013509 [Trametes meyenii]|nr:hypothetical protein C8Q79DRAFT_1013509 [Trametes meyenii]
MQSHSNIISPRPQVCAYNFAKILRWEESLDTLELLSGAASEKSLAHIQSGGVYTQRVLACGREVAKYVEATQYALGAMDPASANQAPPWPPAPQLVAGHIHIGLRSEIAYTYGAYTATYEAARSTSRIRVQHHAAEVETFIGRDGTEWPMPPPECRGNAFARQETNRAVFPHSPTPPLLNGTSSTSRESSTASTAVLTPAPSLSVELDADPLSPPATSTFRELGRQWYASFGVEVGASPPSNTAIRSRHPTGVHSRSEYSSERLPPDVVYGSRGNVLVGSDGSLWPMPPDRHIFHTTT